MPITQECSTTPDFSVNYVSYIVCINIYYGRNTGGKSSATRLVVHVSRQNFYRNSFGQGKTVIRFSVKYIIVDCFGYFDAMDSSLHIEMPFQSQGTTYKDVCCRLLFVRLPLFSITLFSLNCCSWLTYFMSIHISIRFYFLKIMNDTCIIRAPISTPLPLYSN